MRMDHQQEEEGVEVQMAPLIDCVFLLLIFFLVASTLKKLDKELDVELPQAAAAISVQAPENLLVIGVDDLGNTYINAEQVSNTALHETLRERAAMDPTQRVRLDIDRRTPFQYVVRVFDLAQLEGLTNVGIHIAKDNPY